MPLDDGLVVFRRVGFSDISVLAARFCRGVGRAVNHLCWVIVAVGHAGNFTIEASKHHQVMIAFGWKEDIRGLYIAIGNMRISTIILTTIWVALGIPLWFVMNFWTDKWYVPFPIHPDENFVVWLVTLSLVYLLPLYLLSVAAFYLMRRYWR